MKDQVQNESSSQFLKMDGGETKTNAIEVPSISLPKGGGALKGIDEKFEVNSANGSAGFNIPLPVSPGRNGFGPELSLSYNSSGGNGPYGLGWSVGFPMIQRKTDKKLPKYQDGLDEDVFMFSGAEDLVPFLEDDNGEWKEKAYPNNGADGYFLKRYRPRVEGGFARIEKILHSAHGVYWKVTTRDNVATLFGRSPSARIADPSDGNRIFQWMPEFSYDDKGNWIKYEYTEENLDNVPHSIEEKNRLNGLAPVTNQYLKRIKYGNHKAYYAEPGKPYDPQPPADDDKYFFELVMDYGEHDKSKPQPQDNGDWDYRADAFSSYRSGFEIRTNRLCKRVLMFHHFEAEWQFVGTPDEMEFGRNYLVRSLTLDYEASFINPSGHTEVTWLKTVTQTGYIRKPDESYSHKSLPPIEFTYQKLQWNKNIKTVPQESIVNAPVGLTNNYQWVDLYGEGISGILSEQGEGWYYKSNLGINDDDGEIAFSVAQQVIPKPSFNGLSNGGLSLQDLAANGEKQIVINSPGLQGYFELTHDQNWQPFKAFEQLANLDLQDPNTRMIDLNGDGQPELVVTEENVFVWYEADGKLGHLPAAYAPKALDEEQGPTIVFADPEQTIFLADMAGDGLTDIVRIRNGEICYWANMGYGKFSAKISMDNAPLFDHPDLFNPQYLHLADVSGTGATDIIYLGENKFKAYINLSGNAWSNAHEIEPFLTVDSNSRLSVIDLLGTGTSCIVWSSDLPAYSHAPMRYMDLMDSKKPHVLVHYKNNLGAETSIEFKSSTHYYLADKLAGKPWITRLPFAVQVVSKMLVEEKITNVRFSTEYRYHHGYYDHPEREFRGFGMVEQLDTEFYETWKVNNQGNQQDSSGELYQPPMLSKTWFHTGAFLDRERILTHFKEEYWHEAYNRQFPLDALNIKEPELPDAHLSDAVRGLNEDEYREALRACKGMMLRQEVFALDAPENATEAERKREMKPYTVATHNCTIQLLQPRGGNPFGVFIVTESEAITVSYERDETDFRLAHTLNTKIDDLGNVLESASVVYGRDTGKADADFQALTDAITDFSEEVLNNDAAQKTQLRTAFDNNIAAAKAEQTKTHIIYSQNSFARFNDGILDVDDIDLPHAYRLRLPHEAKTYEITGIVPVNGLFQISEMDNAMGNTAEIAYHTAPTIGIPQIRLIEHIKTKYLKDDLSSLEFGLFDTVGLPFESYQLAYTPELVTEIYSKQDGTELQANGIAVSNFIQDKGKYTEIDGDLWIRSGRTHFTENTGEAITRVKDRFYVPLAFEDPFGTKTKVVYDIETFANGVRENDGYYLFIRETEDILNNKSQVDIFNYRTLSPSRMIDINANPSSVLLDELGSVKAVAAEGNGSYTDASRTSVQLLQAADDLFGLKEFAEDFDTAAINQLFSSATFNSTKTAQLRAAGNNLLQHASARFVYDFDVYKNVTDQNAKFIADGEPEKVLPLKPTVVASIVREEHFSDNPTSSIQFSLEYSDGAGNVAMAKAQAEPGLAWFMEDGVRKEKNTGDTNDLRWIGNGRNVLNNKGNPVKQYEPYFSTNFGFEDAPELLETGVTPIIYYDAVGRVIKTELPDGTLTRVEFDSWKQSSFDQNDTVLESMWHAQRLAADPVFEAALIAQGKDPQKEQQAAIKAEAHSDTPSSMYLDSLGRPVLSIEHNGKDAINRNRLYTTFIQLDIEGNAREVIDSRGNKVMAYKYDMLGHRVYQNSMDAGERWMLNNLMGNPVHAWDERNHVFEHFYDTLQRPTHSKVIGSDATDNTVLNHLFNRIFYGETVPDPELKNLRGQVIKLYDTGGLIETPEYDFKGQPVSTTRKLFKKYKEVANWTDFNLADLDNVLEPGDGFTFKTKTDALGRITEQNAPDGSIIAPTYNEAGLLNGESVKHSDPDITTSYIIDIDYNEKGQRSKIIYGNNVSTNYHYDKDNFRLVRLVSQRKNQNQDPLQDLHYTYDPVGNITHIEDKAIPINFFANSIIEPLSEYSYDALYRLATASGRENNAALNFGTCDNWNDKPFRHSMNPGAGDSMAVRNYDQSYLYDAVGNIREMKHLAPGGNWTRSYDYETTNNRLKTTRIGDNGNPANYTKYKHHEKHGFLEELPHLEKIGWNFKDEVELTTRQHCTNDNIPVITYYQYDGSGQRIRKITENQAAPGGTLSKKEERIYVAGYETFKTYQGNTVSFERDTLSLLDEGHRFVMVETVKQNADLAPSTSERVGARLIRYQLHNHLGSAALELDETARMISYEEYHPYGTTAYQANNEDIKSAAKRYRYTGMERDEESGLNYHSTRYYLPWLGRWLSGDPVGIEGGMNLYEYARNTPTKLSDSTGMEPENEQETSTDWQISEKEAAEYDVWRQKIEQKYSNQREREARIPKESFKKRLSSARLYAKEGRNPVSVWEAGYGKYFYDSERDLVYKALDNERNQTIKNNIAGQDVNKTNNWVQGGRQRKFSGNAVFIQGFVSGAVGGLLSAFYAGLELGQLGNDARGCYNSIDGACLSTAVNLAPAALGVVFPMLPREVKTSHKATSGARLTQRMGKTTTVIGNYHADLKGLLNELNVSAQSGNLDEIIIGFDANKSGRLNFLNVTADVVKQGEKRGGFFNYANSKWVDAAIKRGDTIIVVTKNIHMYRTNGNLNGFGKEVLRFIEVHGYKWNADGTKLLPPR